MTRSSARSALAVAALALSACSGSPAEPPVPPFAIDVEAVVEGRPSFAVGVADRIDLAPGQTLVLRARILDARGAALRRAIDVSGGNAFVLGQIATVVDGDRGRTEIVYRALAPGVAAIALTETGVGVQRFVFVDVTAGG